MSFLFEGQYELAVDSDVLEVPFTIVKDNVTVIHTFTSPEALMLSKSIPR